MAVTLEVPFEPVPLRPLPALGRHPRLFRMPATRPRSGFLRAGVYREPGRSTGAARPASRSSGAARRGHRHHRRPGARGCAPGQGISASGSHDVWFEGLTIQNAIHGAVFHDAARIVVRHCHIRRVDYGITATRNTQGTAADHFISDNLIEGPSTWPRTKGIEDARGIQVSGQGHVVCYNRIRGFADAIDTFPSRRCAAIDFYNNDRSELTDDGIEMDYSERNTRCFHNRLTNVFQGISMQPVYGGPVYVFRNVMYNVAVEPFKLHNNPSGCLMFHNTSVKNGTPAQLWTSESVRHCLSRNNLFVGTQAHYGMDFTARMMDCDFDYDGFAGGPYEIFLRWNGIRYGTLEEVKQRAPVLKHAVLLDARTLFASGAMPPTDVARSHDTLIDLRLSSRSKAVDAGQALSGWNDGFRGLRPDLGAYELGDSPPHYGPRDARVDADYRDTLAATTIHPFRVVHRWTEHGQAKTHTELITKLPAKYAIRTSGEPEMVSVAYEMAATR